MHLLLLALLTSSSPALELPPPPTAARKLDFKNGEPLIPVRLMEGGRDVTFSAKGRLKFRLGGKPEKTLDAAAGTVWTVRLDKGVPAVMTASIQLAEFPFLDKQGLAAAQLEWEGKGFKLRTHTLGGMFGIAGKVIDNRRYVLLLDEPATDERQAELLQKYSVRSTLFEQLKEPAHGTLLLLNDKGEQVASAIDRLDVEPQEAETIEVRRVEYGVGYDFHNFEDRSYRGSLQLIPDKRGKLAVVNVVGLEQLLYGLVPSEIFAKAHAEALKAQAVTARGEILAKVGLKHAGDAYPLCSEQHCAVYKGLSGEAASTNAAVDATLGEAAFDEKGKLVDSVYSAICGGHSEHNDIVWGGVPNPSLRGKPDLLPGKKPTASPDKLSAFLTTEQPHACRVSSFTNAKKFRWEKRFTAKELDEITKNLGLGSVMAMSVTERGVSGRARLLSISGENGATQLKGELVIRKQFGMLNSAMFELRTEKDPKGRPSAWIFTGGGWGHGVGMCQTGAIGRAEAGQSYREILGHYYNGAQVAPLYGR